MAAEADRGASWVGAHAAGIVSSAMSFAGRVARAIGWLAASAGVAFAVARASQPGGGEAIDLAPPPPIAVASRATVTLDEVDIVPVISAPAVVVANDGGGWALQAVVPTDALAYQLLDPPIAVRAKISGGPGGFTCAWIGLAAAGSGAYVPSTTGLGGGGTGVVMRCAAPADVRAVAGMSAIMVVQTGTQVTGQGLPVTAVVGDAGSGLVVVVGADGALATRAVSLGASDAYNIVILDGLATGETVLRNPTQQDLAAGMATS